MDRQKLVSKSCTECGSGLDSFLGHMKGIQEGTHKMAKLAAELGYNNEQTVISWMKGRRYPRAEARVTMELVAAKHGLVLIWAPMDLLWWCRAASVKEAVAQAVASEVSLFPAVGLSPADVKGTPLEGIVASPLGRDLCSLLDFLRDGSDGMNATSKMKSFTESLGVTNGCIYHWMRSKSNPGHESCKRIIALACGRGLRLIWSREWDLLWWCKATTTRRAVTKALEAGVDLGKAVGLRPKDVKGTALERSLVRRVASMPGILKTTETAIRKATAKTPPTPEERYGRTGLKIMANEMRRYTMQEKMRDPEFARAVRERRASARAARWGPGVPRKATPERREKDRQAA